MGPGTTLYLVRTGGTRRTHDGVPLGRSEEPLSAEGVGEAVRAAERLRGSDLTAVYTSPLRRARQTADVIAGVSHPPVPVRTLDGVTDVDAGTWADLDPDGVRAVAPAAFDAYFRFPTTATFPDGEWTADAERRAFAALSSLPDPEQGDVVAVVTHELIIRLALVRLKRLEGTAFWDPHVPPGSVFALRVTEAGLEVPSTLEDLFRAAERRRGA